MDLSEEFENDKTVNKMVLDQDDDTRVTMMRITSAISGNFKWNREDVGAIIDLARQMVRLEKETS